MATTAFHESTVVEITVDREDATVSRERDGPTFTFLQLEPGDRFYCVCHLYRAVSKPVRYSSRSCGVLAVRVVQ